MRLRKAFPDHFYLQGRFWEGPWTPGGRRRPGHTCQGASKARRKAATRSAWSFSAVSQRRGLAGSSFPGTATAFSRCLDRSRTNISYSHKRATSESVLRPCRPLCPTASRGADWLAGLLRSDRQVAQSRPVAPGKSDGGCRLPVLPRGAVWRPLGEMCWLEGEAQLHQPFSEPDGLSAEPSTWKHGQSRAEGEDGCR
jgi:hypothetical protein